MERPSAIGLDDELANAPTGARREVLENEFGARHLLTDDPRLNGHQIEYMVLQGSRELYVWKKVQGGDNYYQLHLKAKIDAKFPVN